jgi:ParB-like chromosome segregation protein Spo0J
MESVMNNFDGNIRTSKPLDDNDLRASLKGGWDKELPAIEDENGVLIVGHRRMKIALAEGIEPVVKTVVFGTGPEADAARVRLANVSNIGGAPMTKEDRKAQAERLYKSGLTMEAIGHMLGVAKGTVSKDLSGIVSVETIKTRAKTDTNPKGAGRPKGPPRPKPHTQRVEAEREAASMVLDEGKTIEQAAVESGLNSIQIVKTAVAREEGRREPRIDPSELSMSAREKFEAAIRQYKRDLDREFRERVRQEVRAEFESIWLPAYQKDLDDAKAMRDAYNGVMTRKTFMKILSCLHADSRNSASDEKLNEAFRAFKSFEVVLVKPEEPSHPTLPWPKTYQELQEMKRKASETRKAKRRTRSGTNSMAMN